MNSDKLNNRSIFVLPFSHLDLFWLGNRDECLSRTFDGITKAMQFCRSNPEFRYLVEDGVVFSEFVHTYPEVKPELLDMIRRGQFECPAKWAAATITQVNGEVIAHNMLYGLNEVEAICGKRPEVIHLGDLPGMTPQFPQILAKSGIRYAVISRGGPRKTPLFRWQALDGSDVLTWYSPHCYSWGMPLADSPESFAASGAAKLEEEADAIYSTSPFGILMHYGMDLSVPRAEAIGNVSKWNETSKYAVQFGRQIEYFESVRNSEGIPILAGEIPTVWGAWPDCAFLDVTIHHAAAERALLWAERMVADDILNRRKLSDVNFAELWKPLLESLDHNYSGNAPEEYHATKNRFTTVSYQRAENVVLQRMTRIASEVERPQDSIPVVVFNPSSFERTDRIRRRVMLFGDSLAATSAKWADFHLEDKAGNIVPMQVPVRRSGPTKEADFEFLATDVPALGYKTYYLRPDAADSSAANLKLNDTGLGVNLGSDVFDVKVCKQTGAVRICGSDGTPIIQNITLQAVEMLQTNQTMQLDSTGRVFPFLCNGVEISETGQVCTEVRLMGSIAEVPVQTRIKITNYLPRLDVRCSIDWPGNKYLRIQAYLNLPGRREESVFTGVPFGANAFDNIIPGSGPWMGDEVTPDTWARTREAQDWFLMAQADADFAVAVATERKLIEFFDDGCAINFISGMTPKWMQPEIFHPFAGHFETGFSICTVNKGDIDTAARFGETRFMPLRALCSYNQSETMPRDAAESGIELTGDGVRLSCLKPAEDGNGVITRLIECRGLAATASIKLKGAGDIIWECNLIEENSSIIDPNSLSFRPFEIKTLRFAST